MIRIAVMKPKTNSTAASWDPSGLENVLVWNPVGFRLGPAGARAEQLEEERQFFGRSAGIRARGNADVLTVLKKGLPLGHFEKLRKTMGLTSIELARVARISLRTLHRRKAGGRIHPEESERIFRIACVFDKAIDVLGSEESARKWFRTPLRALSMKAPLEYSDMELGLREIEHVLGRIEHGVFS
jgi:putative toxin-antitoxin system antitoxin component (TIGR02293 family)